MSEESAGLVAQQFGVALDMVPGLDGTTWPRMQFVYGLTAYTITLPFDKFEALINQLGKEGRMLIAEVHEKNQTDKKKASSLTVVQGIPDSLRKANPAKSGLHGKRR